MATPSIRFGRDDATGPEVSLGASSAMGWKSSIRPIRRSQGRRCLRSRRGKKNLGSAGALDHQGMRDSAHASNASIPAFTFARQPRRPPGACHGGGRRQRRRKCQHQSPHSTRRGRRQSCGHRARQSGQQRRQRLAHPRPPRCGPCRTDAPAARPTKRRTRCAADRAVTCRPRPLRSRNMWTGRSSSGAPPPAEPLPARSNARGARPGDSAGDDAAVTCDAAAVTCEDGPPGFRNMWNATAALR